jgi:hypothetical protein
MIRAPIAEPVMFDDSLLFARPHKRRRRGSRPRRLGCFHQEQLTLSEFQKWSAALIVCAPAKHDPTFLVNNFAIEQSIRVHTKCQLSSAVYC